MTRLLIHRGIPLCYCLILVSCLKPDALLATVFQPSSDVITIPVSWVTEATSLTDDQWEKRTELVTTFGELVLPGKFPPPTSMRDSHLSILSSNLDEDAEIEQIMFIGRQDGPSFFFVLKRSLESWHIVYARELYSHHPKLHAFVLNNDSVNKIFCAVRTEGEGTGVHDSWYDVFRIINGKVKLCLSLPELKYDVYSHVESRIEGSSDDFLVATFHYCFHPPQEQVQEILGREGSLNVPDVIYVEGRNTIWYQWNATIQMFEPVFDPTLSTLNNLTVPKLQCLVNPYNEELFRNAFAEELQNSLMHGTPNQKRLIEKLLQR